MSQLTSATARGQAIAQHQTDPFIVLITISHEKLPENLYFARNRQAVVSRGNTFAPLPFTLKLPNDGEGPPEARLIISNTSRRIGRALEALTVAPNVDLELVLASTPDIVERAWTGLSFTQASWNAATAELTLGHIDFWSEPWPRKRTTPSAFPGLFP